MVKPNKETPRQTKERAPEHLLLKEKIINDLDAAIGEFQGEQIGVFRLFASAAEAWGEANQNPNLKSAIKEEIKRRRIILHQMMPLSINKDGDPFEKRYNPDHWLKIATTKKNPRVFLLDRTISLKDFLGSL